MKTHTTHYACKEQMDKYGGKTKGCCCTGHNCNTQDNLPNNCAHLGCKNEPKDNFNLCVEHLPDVKELDIFMDDYFFDHHPISKENARKRIQSLLKQAELLGQKKEVKAIKIKNTMSWIGTAKRNIIYEIDITNYKKTRLAELEAEMGNK